MDVIKLQRAELKIIAKCIGISAAIAVAIPIILWIVGKIASGPGGSDLMAGFVVVSIAMLNAAALLLPWRLFFDWSSLYDHWPWFAAVDLLIIGLIGGLLAVRRQRRAHAPTSHNPF